MIDACVTLLRARAENSKRKALTQRAQRRHRGDTEDTETSCKELAACSLAEVGDFLVEVGQGGFERFAMVGVGGGSEVVGDAGAR